MDFSLSELQNAIRAFPTGKAAGPDWVGPEIYKAFHRVFTPRWLRMIRDTIKNKQLPSSLSEDKMCVILKKDMDETQVATGLLPYLITV